LFDEFRDRDGGIGLKLVIFILTLGLALFACSAESTSAGVGTDQTAFPDGGGTEDGIVSLAEKYKDHFLIGAAIDKKSYQDKPAARCKEFFDMFRMNSDLISNVTFWGIADDSTRLSEFPSGRPDHPLLFDPPLRPKEAFFAVTDF